MEQKKGLLMVISGPAGTGKGTTVKCIVEGGPDKDPDIAARFHCSVSATTRAPRPGEVDGVSYHFITKEAFEEKIKRGEMLEYTEYCGNYYGTPKSEVTDYVNRGIHVILEIEVDGGTQVKKVFPDTVLLMLLPPDFATLEQRLRDRGTNTEADIANRLRRSREELEFFDSYDYVVINHQNQSGRAAAEIIGIIAAEQSRTQRNAALKRDFFGK